MLVFVVGPSRGGKTTLLKRAASVLSQVELLDLDAEEHRTLGLQWSGALDTGGWSGRWARDRQRLAEAEQRSQDNDIVVDAGAGSLQTDD